MKLLRLSSETLAPKSGVLVLWTTFGASGAAVWEHLAGSMRISGAFLGAVGRLWGALARLFGASGAPWVTLAALKRSIPYLRPGKSQCPTASL